MTSGLDNHRLLGIFTFFVKDQSCTRFSSFREHPFAPELNRIWIFGWLTVKENSSYSYNGSSRARPIFGEVLKRRLFEVKTFSPGDTVAQSGVYRVMHDRHRADHKVIVLAGDVLPLCCTCKGFVRFRLEEPINYATHDWDLTGPLFNSKKASSE